MSKRAVFYIVIILCCLVISVFLLLSTKKHQPEPAVDFPIPPLPMEDSNREPQDVPGLFD